MLLPEEILGDCTMTGQQNIFAAGYDIMGMAARCYTCYIKLKIQLDIECAKYVYYIMSDFFCV